MHGLLYADPMRVHMLNNTKLLVPKYTDSLYDQFSRIGLVSVFQPFIGMEQFEAFRLLPGPVPFQMDRNIILLYLAVHKNTPTDAVD